MTLKFRKTITWLKKALMVVCTVYDIGKVTHPILVLFSEKLILRSFRWMSQWFLQAYQTILRNYNAINCCICDVEIFRLCSKLKISSADQLNDIQYKNILLIMPSTMRKAPEDDYKSRQRISDLTLDHELKIQKTFANN